MSTDQNCQIGFFYIYIEENILIEFQPEIEERQLLFPHSLRRGGGGFKFSIELDELFKVNDLKKFFELFKDHRIFCESLLILYETFQLLVCRIALKTLEIDFALKKASSPFKIWGFILVPVRFPLLLLLVLSNSYPGFFDPL